MTERAKVDKLLTKVQNTTLAAAVAPLRYQLNTEGISFTAAANHLNSEISQTSDYQLARKISAYRTGGRGTGCACSNFRVCCGVLLRLVVPYLN